MSKAKKLKPFANKVLGVLLYQSLQLSRRYANC